MNEESEHDDAESTTLGRVRDLYEKFPYPSTFQDGPRRGVGLPSYLPAIDHYIFGGCRDISKPIRILVSVTRDMTALAAR